jgi:hypothetical protein|tara:strand:+ start:1987 stop:2145 length:159 start_codon:yes stop_codon:yes gene_type:complete
MARYKVEFEKPPVMYIKSNTNKALRNEVIEAWVSYSGYDLPDYTVTEVQEEE